MGDFDYGVKDKGDINKFWINMGLVVAVLNHFSAVESGGKNGENMFEVDIQNSVIGGHPNLVSCDSRVLIPNSKAPKFLYGKAGINKQYRRGNVIRNKESKISLFYINILIPFL